MAINILVTGFEPFGGARVNASLAVAQALAERGEADTALILPVVRGEAEAKLWEYLRSADSDFPDLVVSLGEADDTPHVRLEKVAINWDDFRIPDNAGNQPRDTPIRADGPDAYFATLPVSSLAEGLIGRTPLPVVVSLTAGAFLCNHLAYTMLDGFATGEQESAVPYLFVHVPRWRPDGTLSLHDLVDTVTLILQDAAASLVAPAMG